MGKPVTVDSDDLETLLHVTGAMKNIERAVAGAKDDPLRTAAMGRYETVHRTLLSALTNTMREDRPELNEPLTDDDKALLQEFDETGITSIVAGADFLECKRRFDGLARRMLVEFGQSLRSTQWGSQGVSNWAVDPSRLFVRLTPRGMAARKELLSVTG